MESMLGFKEPLQCDVVEEKSQSLKLVPWISWDEWRFVKKSIFSPSHASVASALRRISAWRSRGCIPVAVDVTASIVEIQQKDPFFRAELEQSATHSEEMLSMLYCMSIMRLVNGVIEKTRKKNEISIGEAADNIGLPRMLIDIRHEVSHRDLPSLQLVRLASKQALDWLVSYYWQPQDKEILEDETTNTKKDIKRKLRQAALCLKGRRIEKSSSSQVNEKYSKKQLSKSLKNVLRLYSSFSPQVVEALLEFLVNASESSNSSDLPDDSPIARPKAEESKQTAYDDWKCVVMKLSRKNPEFLLTLTQAALGKMESQASVDYKTRDHHFTQRPSNSRQFEGLALLFEWLVTNLKTLYTADHRESPGSKSPSTAKILPKSAVMGLLRRCLLISTPNTKSVMASVPVLAQLTNDSSLLQKLRKLSLVVSSNSEEGHLSSGEETLLLSEQEQAIQLAKRKFELLRHRKKSRKMEGQNDSEIASKSSKWSVAKSWNPCPIGMLPHTIGLSGRLPILEHSTISDEQNRRSKREPERGVEERDGASVKKMKIECNDFGNDEESVGGRLLMAGEWKRVGGEELMAIASSIRLLV